jgi:hypothetical protein
LLKYKKTNGDKMTWIISRAMMKAYENSPCSQGLVEEYWEGNYSDGERFAPLNVIVTPHPFWLRDKTIDILSHSRFSQMCLNLPEEIGEDVLMSFRRDFLARIYQQPEKAQESEESEADCGERWRGLSVKYDPDTCSWKTHHCLFQEDLDESCLTFADWGMMQDGVLLEPITSVRLKDALEFGSLRKSKTDNQDTEQKTIGFAHGADSLFFQDASATTENGCAKIAENGHTRFVMRNGTVARSVAPEMWLTPSANEDAAGTPKGNMQAMLGNHPMIRGETPEQWKSGTLNPMWVEWLMGWPLGWTDLEPLETGKFQQWLNSHGKS